MAFSTKSFATASIYSTLIRTDFIFIMLNRDPIPLSGLSRPFELVSSNNFSMIADGYLTYQGGLPGEFLVSAQYTMGGLSDALAANIYIAVDNEVIANSTQTSAAQNQFTNDLYVSTSIQIPLLPKQSVSIFYAGLPEIEAELGSAQLTITQI